MTCGVHTGRELSHLRPPGSFPSPLRQPVSSCHSVTQPFTNSSVPVTTRLPTGFFDLRRPVLRPLPRPSRTRPALDSEVFFCSPCHFLPAPPSRLLARFPLSQPSGPLTPPRLPCTPRPSRQSPPLPTPAPTPQAVAVAQERPRLAP